MGACTDLAISALRRVCVSILAHAYIHLFYPCTRSLLPLHLSLFDLCNRSLLTETTGMCQHTCSCIHTCMYVCIRRVCVYKGGYVFTKGGMRQHTNMHVCMYMEGMCV